MPILTTARLLVSATLILLTSAFLRLLYILPCINPQPPPRRKRRTPTRILIVLGSGGHTSEMMAMLSGVDPKLYRHRSYICSEGDEFSARLATGYETALARKGSPGSSGHKGGENEPSLGRFDVSVVPRARKIHQPLLTTPFSALRCLFACFRVLGGSSDPEQPYDDYPDLVLTNGPGTGVCVIFACLLLKYFGVRGTQGKMRSVYVESWARVKRLSLSGKILLWCVDRFLVQWEGLKHVGGRAEYRGVLV